LARKSAPSRREAGDVGGERPALDRSPQIPCRWPKVLVWTNRTPAISSGQGIFVPAVSPFDITTSTRTQPRSASSRSTQDGYCPHCHLLIQRRVGEDWPQQPQRCPHCRLLVGVGRGRPTPSAEPGARGSAAGVFAHEAKRAGGEGDATKDEVRRAIRKVAKDSGQRPERLLMVDYQQLASDDEDLPALSDVFAAYGSWKRARRAAAESK
jgi:hypothetical protein